MVLAGTTFFSVRACPAFSSARDSMSSAGGDSTQLLTLVHEKAPALVVVDIRMPPTHTAEGLEAARHIRQEHPETGILVLSAHVEVEYAIELLASGRGIGYLLKSRVTDVEEFIETLQRTAKNAQWSIQRWSPS